MIIMMLVECFHGNKVGLLCDYSLALSFISANFSERILPVNVFQRTASQDLGVVS